jgi:hypothetical protein
MGLPPSDEAAEDCLEDAFDDVLRDRLQSRREIPTYGRKTRHPGLDVNAVEAYIRKSLWTPEYALWRE